MAGPTSAPPRCRPLRARAGATVAASRAGNHAQPRQPARPAPHTRRRQPRAETAARQACKIATPRSPPSSASAPRRGRNPTPCRRFRRQPDRRALGQQPAEQVCRLKPDGAQRQTRCAAAPPTGLRRKTRKPPVTSAIAVSMVRFTPIGAGRFAASSSAASGGRSPPRRAAAAAGHPAPPPASPSASRRSMRLRRPIPRPKGLHRSDVHHRQPPPSPAGQIASHAQIHRRRAGLHAQAPGQTCTRASSPPRWKGTPLSDSTANRADSSAARW